ncbi:MAG: hypothetical protein AB7U20_04650 [Planctomycetaceae bacterium]
MASSTANVDLSPTARRRDRRAARVLSWSLRLFGSVDLLATVAVVMPVAWLKAGHALCGLGEFPAGPLPLYLARSTSLLYAFHGAILWFLATDVRRFAPLIRFIGGVTIAFGSALVFIDLAAGIPPWWTWSEGPVFAASGTWLLAWNSRVSKHEMIR